MYIYICKYTYIYVYIYICIYCKYIYMYIYICIYIHYIYIYTHIHIPFFTHTHIYIYIHIFYAHAYIYTLYIYMAKFILETRRWQQLCCARGKTQTYIYIHCLLRVDIWNRQKILTKMGRCLRPPYFTYYLQFFFPGKNVFLLGKTFCLGHLSAPFCGSVESAAAVRPIVKHLHRWILI